MDPLANWPVNFGLKNVGAMKTFGTDSDDEPSERQKYNQLAAGPCLQESTTTHRSQITSRGESEVTAFHL